MLSIIFSVEMTDIIDIVVVCFEMRRQERAKHGKSIFAKAFISSFIAIGANLRRCLFSGSLNLDAGMIIIARDDSRWIVLQQFRAAFGETVWRDAGVKLKRYYSRGF